MASSMPKVSSTLTGARGKVNTAVLKSAKENIKAQAFSASVTKVTTDFSTQPKPLAKAVNNSRCRPLQARTSSSPGAKDADTAALLARIAQQQGLSIHLSLINILQLTFSLAEINRLKKSQAPELVEKKLDEIPRPDKITKLQHDMGLADNKRLYSHCRVSFLFFLPVSLGLILKTGNCPRCSGPWWFTA
jgi:hypothetical protein